MVRRLGALYLERKARQIAFAVIFWIIILVVILKWNCLYSLAITGIQGAEAGINSWLPTTLGANYLLMVLIVATIGVAILPFFIRWANRPKLSLRSVAYLTTKIRRNGPSTSAPTRRIFLVLLELWNGGRGLASDPVIETQVFDAKIPKIAEWSGNVESDVAILDSIPRQVDTATYDYVEDDELAVQFLAKGIMKVDYLPGRKAGKKILFGFAFEDGKKFYMPSKEVIEMQTLPVGDEKTRYAWFAARARNSPKKIVAKNVKLTLPKWNEVNLDYANREEDVKLLKDIRSAFPELSPS